MNVYFIIPFLHFNIFQTHDTLEHLAMMERVLGKVPSSMTSKSKYFRSGKLDWDENSKVGRRVKHKCRPLRSYMRSHSTKHNQLFDLIERMLEYRPEKRITLKEALKHPFFRDWLRNGLRVWCHLLHVYKVSCHFISIRSDRVLILLGSASLLPKLKLVLVWFVVVDVDWY